MVEDTTSDEKKESLTQSSVDVGVGGVGILVDDGVVYDNEHEIFKKTTEGMDYRNVGWIRAMFIFFKGC
jgi:hypothetical protein